MWFYGQWWSFWMFIRKYPRTSIFIVTPFHDDSKVRSISYTLKIMFTHRGPLNYGYFFSKNFWKILILPLKNFTLFHVYTLKIMFTYKGSLNYSYFFSKNLWKILILPFKNFHPLSCLYIIQNILAKLIIWPFCLFHVIKLIFVFNLILYLVNFYQISLIKHLLILSHAT